MLIPPRIYTWLQEKHRRFFQYSIRISPFFARFSLELHLVNHQKFLQDFFSKFPPSISLRISSGIPFMFSLDIFSEDFFRNFSDYFFRNSSSDKKIINMYSAINYPDISFRSSSGMSSTKPFTVFFLSKIPQKLL